MKKALAIGLAAVMAVSMSAPVFAEDEGKGIAKEDLKVGVIYIGDENEGYTAAHMKGIDEMEEKLGLDDSQIIEKTLIGEDEGCYDAAADLADQGCQKLNEMIEDGTVKEDACKMGYVGAFPYAEVISGYTAFYLGAKSVCPSVTMEVKYTNSWASFDLEKECADALISDGCVLISQHADTTGAPTACEAAGVPCVGYNIDMTSVAPNTALTSASMDWGVYYTYAVQCMLDGTAIDTDWCKGFAEGADKITTLNDKTVAEGTEEKVKEVEDALIDGSLHVFDTSAFTVDGKELDTYKKGDTEYISDGYFHESEYGSAPAFDIAIDGITSITE